MTNNVLTRSLTAVARLFRKSRTFRTIYFNLGGGAPSWSKSDAQQFAREGYSGNPYVYAACEAITDAMTEGPPVLYRVRKGSKIERAYKAEYNLERAIEGRSRKAWTIQETARAVVRSKTSEIVRKTSVHPRIARRLATKQLAINGELEEVSAHPVLDLIARPNGYYQTTFNEFIKAYGLSLLLAGESYIEPMRFAEDGDTAGEPDELYVIPPHTLVPLTPKQGNPIPGWRSNGARTDPFYYDPDPLKTELFYSKFYDPINPTRGLSPMEAASRSVELNNRAREWNATLIGNAAVPPGLVTGEFDEGGAQALQDYYAENVAGAANAGRLMTLSGENLKYTPLAVDAAKLQWGDTLSLSAREVSVVFGVAPEVLGDAANKTYSNYQEARLALYQDTALPLADFMYAAFNSSFVRRFGDDLLLDYDADQIQAISADIERAYERLQGASFLTINEKRAAVGYEDIDGGDVILVPLTQVPLSALAFAEETKEQREKVERLLQSAGLTMNGVT